MVLSIGADVKALELGSITRQKMADCLTPLFDRELIDLEGECIYCPEKVEIFTEITLSVSVYVRPALFTRGYATLPDHSASKGKVSGWTKTLGGTKTRVVTGIMVDGGGQPIPVDDSYNPIGAFVELLSSMGITAFQSSTNEPVSIMPAPSSISSPSPSSSSSSSSAPPVEADCKRAPPSSPSSSSSNGETKEPAVDSTTSNVSTSSSSSSTSVTPVKNQSKGGSSSSNGGATAGEDDGEDNDSELRVSAFQLESLYASAQSVAANIPELGQPSAMLPPCRLRRYQRQALYWMNARERQAVQVLSSSSGVAVRHPLWDEYQIDTRNNNGRRRSSSSLINGDADDATAPFTFYLNPFNTQASLTFPAALPTARGGILADEMGMGKTVMCIALMLASMPDNVPLPLPYGDVEEKSSTASSSTDTDNDDKDSKSALSALRTGGGRAAKAGQSTLVICPMSLISQWRDEISRFSSLNALVYYGSANNRVSGGTQRLSGYDVVITSYGTLGSESRANPPPILDEHGQPVAGSKGEKGSPLLSMSWYRVICDEAHVIRNRSTETARAVFRLKASRRWCITGTPIQNRLDDVFALLHFLREDPWSDIGWWSTVIARPFEQGEPRALARLKAVLQTLMLRRTKDMKDSKGTSILELPPRIEETLELEFSDVERDFYRVLSCISSA
jgi:DNA repair protein RAD5